MSLRSGLLHGRRIAHAGDPSPVSARLGALGAELEDMDAVARTGEDEAGAWVAARAPLAGLIYDARPPFGAGGYASLRAALDGAWICARAVATGALIPTRAGGRLVFLAPARDAGPLAEAARAGLESLARTLSVEWARHTVTSVAICPGQGTTDTELAELTAFLLGPAGGYYSGCRFDLGRLAAAS